MKKLALLSLPLASLMLVGCSATQAECDPNKELGFIQKIACTNSGSYEQRIETKNTELRGELDYNAALHTELQSTRTEHQQVRRNVEKAQNQISNVNSSIKQTKTQTATKQRNVTKLQSEISAIKKNIANLRTQPPSAANTQELERLRALLIQKEKEAAAAAGF